MANDVIKVKYEADVSGLQQGLNKLVDSNTKLSNAIKTTGDTFKTNLKQATGSVNDLKKATESYTNSFKQLNAAISASGAFADFLKTVREINSELSKPLDASGVGNYSLVIGELKAAFEELKASVRDSGEQTKESTTIWENLAESFKNVKEVYEGLKVPFEIGEKIMDEYNKKLEDGSTVSQGFSESQRELADNINAELMANGHNTIAFEESANATTRAAVSQNLFGRAVIFSKAALFTLKSAIISTGIGALVVGIGMVVERLIDWATKTDETDKKWNESQKNKMDKIKVEVETIERASVTELKKLEIELNNAKLTGKSLEERHAIEQKIEKAQIEKAQKIADQYKDEREKIKDTEKELKKKQDRLTELNAKAENKNLSKKEKEEQKDIKETISILKGKIDIVNNTPQALEDAQQKNAEGEIRRANETKQADEDARKKSLTSAKAYADARVLMAKAGSQEEVKAKIEALTVARDSELANTELTEGEKFKIQQKYLLDIQEVKDQAAKQQLEEAERGIELQLLNVK